MALTPSSFYGGIVIAAIGCTVLIYAITMFIRANWTFYLERSLHDREAEAAERASMWVITDTMGQSTTDRMSRASKVTFDAGWGESTGGTLAFLRQSRVNRDSAEARLTAIEDDDAEEDFDAEAEANDGDGSGGDGDGKGADGGGSDAQLRGGDPFESPAALPHAGPLPAPKSPKSPADARAAVEDAALGTNASETAPPANDGVSFVFDLMSQFSTRVSRRASHVMTKAMGGKVSVPQLRTDKIVSPVRGAEGGPAAASQAGLSEAQDVPLPLEAPRIKKAPEFPKRPSVDERLRQSAAERVSQRDSRGEHGHACAGAGVDTRDKGGPGGPSC
jgi:hypothetical protein